MSNRVPNDSSLTSQSSQSHPLASSDARNAGESPAAEHIKPKLLLAIVATGVMAFIGILTETMTNVLFPTLIEEFHIGTAVVQWLTTGYLLVVSIVAPLSSYLNHRFTLKASFIVAIALCIAGLLTAALAVNFPMLMVARILQGAGTGIALPLMFNIILEQSPRSRLGLLMGVGNMVCAIAPALGPTVGGVGVAAIGWRWMFAILIPFLVIAGVIGAVTIRQPRPTERVHFSWAQLALLMVGFVAFVFALDRFGASITALTSSEPNASGVLALAVVLLIVSVAALVWFAMASKRSRDPLIHMGVLHSAPFRWHLLAYVMLEGVTIGFGYLIPNLAQLGFGSTTTVAGLLILPGALLGAVLAPVGGALLDHFGPMRPILSTMALAIVGIVLMLLMVRLTASVWMICVSYIAYMIGFSMAYPDTMTAGMGAVRTAMQPDGNAMFSTFQQLAGAVGTTVMSICLGVAQSGRNLETDKAAFEAATQRGGRAGMIVLLVVLICAFLANVRAFAIRRAR
ncbi:MAG: MFS transporter [Bifidobacterium choerinum]